MPKKAKHDFNCAASMFLDEYYETRDRIIKTVEQSEAYQKFNNDKSIIEECRNFVYPKPMNGSKGIYNQENIGHHFVSIDMKNANFQTLRHCGVISGNTYKDFLSQFCSGFMLDYIAESKYSRQVIFGKLNPGRTISVEKLIMGKLWRSIENYVDYHNSTCIGDLMCLNSDELILRDDGHCWKELLEKMFEENPDICPVEVRIEEFDLRGFEFSVVKPDSSTHKLGEFYKRSCDAEGKYKAIPLPYHKILTKLMTGDEPNTIDRTVMYEKCRALLLDPICVTEIKN